MTRASLFSTLVLVLATACHGPVSEGPDTAATSAPPGDRRSETHKFEEVAPGVYHATGTGAVSVGSNAMVVVNEEDVLLVDSHITPDAARELVKSVTAVTDKPVRYVVNTHYHFDHAHGNQIFPESVEIIGHEYTRERLLGDVLSEPSYRVIASEARQTRVLATMEEELETVEAADREAMESQLATIRRHLKALGEVTPTPPNTTLLRKLSLFRGSREIQMHHLGRGHTGGDVVVFLPAEKVLFTGDLLLASAPYLGDSFPEEFIQTLEKLKELDFDVIIPGHGPLVRDRSKIDFAQEYLRKYWDQVKKLHGQGRSEEDAIAAVDLAEYGEYTLFRRPEVRALEVRRMYHLLDGGE